jgi:hypothetical protein
MQGCESREKILGSEDPNYRIVAHLFRGEAFLTASRKAPRTCYRLNWVIL